MLVARIGVVGGPQRGARTWAEVRVEANGFLGGFCPWTIRSMPAPRDVPRSPIRCRRSTPGYWRRVYPGSSWAWHTTQAPQTGCWPRKLDPPDEPGMKRSRRLDLAQVLVDASVDSGGEVLEAVTHGPWGGQCFRGVQDGPGLRESGVHPLVEGLVVPMFPGAVRWCPSGCQRRTEPRAAWMSLRPMVCPAWSGSTAVQIAWPLRRP